jgi:zinc resistance-associated protein
MKKLATALGISILIITLSFPVFARGRGWGMGGHMGGFWGGGPGSCGQYDRGYGYQNPEQRTRQNQPDEEFYNDTASLRNKIRSKSAELEAILSSPDPDRGKAQALQKEISELQAKMDEKRLNYELEARKSAPEGSYGRGYGPGRGWR